MLVRWSDIPEADCNGLILGYKVSTYPSPGAVALPACNPAPCPANLTRRPGKRGFPWGGGESPCSLPGSWLCHLQEMVPTILPPCSILGL